MSQTVIEAPSPTLVRRAEASDRDGLARLGEETFRETFLGEFAIPYPQADLAVFLPTAYGPEVIAKILADPGQAVWVAERGGEMVGYAVAGSCTLPYPEVEAQDGELKRLYVRRGDHGGGLGRTLMETALAWLERDGPRRLWIGVWSGNLKARRFYARYGFDKFGDHVFPVGAWIDEEVALRRG